MTTADLTDRMSKMTRGGTKPASATPPEEDEAAESAPVVELPATPSATTSRPGRRSTPRQKVTMDLDADGYESLREAAYVKRVSMTDIVRTLVKLWQKDPRLAASVDRELGVGDE